VQCAVLSAILEQGVVSLQLQAQDSAILHELFDFDWDYLKSCTEALACAGLAQALYEPTVALACVALRFLVKQWIFLGASPVARVAFATLRPWLLLGAFAGWTENFLVYCHCLGQWN